MNTKRETFSVAIGVRLAQALLEHFRPQSEYRHLQVEFANLFLSCGGEVELGRNAATCGHAKGNRFNEAQCIEPEYPTCTQRFWFLLNGRVAPAQANDTAALWWIETLNLNHRVLRRDRADFLRAIEDGPLGVSDFVDPETKEARSYARVACQRLSAEIP